MVAVAVEHRDQHLVSRLPKMVRTDPFLYQVSVIRERRPGCRPHLRGVHRCFGFRTSPLLGATQLCGRPFDLPFMALPCPEAGSMFYPPFESYPALVLAQRA